MILVTGASGNVGSEVVRCLEARGVPYRVGARRPGAGPARRAGAPSPREVETVALDLTDTGTFRGAVRGCEAVFLLRPPAVSDTQKTLCPFLDIAREEGVKQVVFLSVAGVASSPVVPHHAVEEHLRRGPEGWTILRPGFFAQNLGDAYRDDIVEENRIFVPAGEGRAAFIDVRDVAEVAAAALVDPAAHRCRVHTLTGPEAVSFSEVAAVLSRELGRPIRYEAASIPGYLHHLQQRGMSAGQALVQTALHVGLRFGQAQAVDPTLARLLGRPPRTIQDYVRDHRQSWAREVPVRRDPAG